MPGTLTLLSFLFLLAAGVVAIFRVLQARAESYGPKRVSQTPVFVHLVPPEADAWKDRRKIDEAQAEILAQDFSKLGEYQLFEVPDLMLAAFFNPHQSVLAVLHEHPAVGIWVDVSVEYESGGSLTVSSAPGGGDVEALPWHARAYAPGASFAELVQKLLELRKPETCKSLTAESFSQVFQDRYAEEMMWRALRGGSAAEEIFPALRSSGGAAADGEMETARSSQEVQAVASSSGVRE